MESPLLKEAKIEPWPRKGEEGVALGCERVLGRLIVEAELLKSSQAIEDPGRSEPGEPRWRVAAEPRDNSLTSSGKGYARLIKKEERSAIGGRSSDTSDQH